MIFLELLWAIPLWVIPAIWLGAIIFLGLCREPIMPAPDDPDAPEVSKNPILRLAALLALLLPVAMALRVGFDPGLIGSPGVAFLLSAPILGFGPGLGVLLRYAISQALPSPPKPAFTVEGATLNGKPLD